VPHAGAEERGKKVIQDSAASERHSSLAPGQGNPVSGYFRNHVITPFRNELIFLLKACLEGVSPVSVAKILQNQVSLMAGSLLVIPGFATS